MSTDSPVNTKPAAAPAPTIEEMEALGLTGNPHEARIDLLPRGFDL